MYTKNPIVQPLQNSSTSHIRVLHAVPDAPNVDVYANDQLVAENLPYGQYTNYITVPSETYEISLYVAGSTDSPVLSNMLTIHPNSIYTIAAVGRLSDISFLAIPDTNMSHHYNMSMIRFVHLSPNAPSVDITLPDGTIIFQRIPFKEVTHYIALPPSDYTLQVRVAGTSTVVLTLPTIETDADKYYTVYALGLVGESPELEALVVLDGYRNNHSIKN